jgi:glycerol-3-phosphate O-acyltransferase/dihydroxyacetone phosphate acyltransferase
LRPLLLALARLILRIFYRSLEVRGAERIPRGRPLVIVANHVNALIDPILLVGTLPVFPSFLAKSTLWGNPVLRPFLDAAGAIPVYRRQDEGVDPAKNAETFARSHELLARGGTLALFPEGISHSHPALQPLKTGAARIVLEAERKFPGTGALIVPVGLTFDAKHLFRSRVLVRVGEPIDPAPEIALSNQDTAEDPVRAVRTLTARIEDALEDVTLNYASWEEARLIRRAADLWDRPTAELPRGRPLGESFAVHRAFLEGLDEMRERFPERVAAVAEAVRAYDRLLQTFRLRDSQVAATYPPFPVARFVARSLVRMLLHLPLAAIGTLLNWPVYRLVGAIASRIAGKPDVTATYKVFGALFLYPVAWLLVAFAVGAWLDNPWLGAATFLAALPTGYVALLFHEHRALFWREARAYLVLRTRKRLAEELKARRAAILTEVEDLAKLWTAATASRSGGNAPS